MKIILSYESIETKTLSRAEKIGKSLRLEFIYVGI